MNENQKKSEGNGKKPLNNYMRFSSVGFQMGLVIFLGVWGGMKIDEKTGNTKQVWTVVCSLLGVFLALYLVIKEVLNMSKGKNKED